MADWNKLNKELDDALSTMTNDEWDEFKRKTDEKRALHQNDVNRIHFVANLNWFDPIDFSDENIQKLTKSEMIELLQMLNKEMIDSLDNWDGG